MAATISSRRTATPYLYHGSWGAALSGEEDTFMMNLAIHFVGYWHRVRLLPEQVHRKGCRAPLDDARNVRPRSRTGQKEETCRGRRENSPSGCSHLQRKQAGTQYLPQLKRHQQNPRRRLADRERAVAPERKFLRSQRK